MSLVLKAPTYTDCLAVRLWRNECLETLRTPYLLTEEQQERFYMDVVCNKDAPHRYWSIWDSDNFVAFGGLTNIIWENRIAEMSLIVNPALRGQGVGEECAKLLLAEGFGKLGLKTICAECYWCNPDGVAFWQKILGSGVILPNRKFWNGNFYNSYYFSIDVDGFNR